MDEDRILSLAKTISTNSPNKDITDIVISTCVAAIVIDSIEGEIK